MHGLLYSYYTVSFARWGKATSRLTGKAGQFKIYYSSFPEEISQGCQDRSQKYS